MKPQRIGHAPNAAAILATHTPCPAGWTCTSSAVPARSIVTLRSGSGPKTVTFGDPGRSDIFAAGLGACVLSVHRHGEHRTRTDVQEPLGYAAQQQSAESGVAASANDDHIATLLPGGLGDRPRCVAHRGACR